MPVNKAPDKAAFTVFTFHASGYHNMSNGQMFPGKKFRLSKGYPTYLNTGPDCVFSTKSNFLLEAERHNFLKLG